MGTKYLIFTTASGYTFYLNFLILFVLLFPLLVWLCAQINKQNWTPVIHTIGFSLFTGVYLYIINSFDVIAVWWYILPVSLFISFAREIYCKIRYNDFDWEDIMYNTIGTCASMTFFWLVN